jgi:putative membrane protein
MNPDRFPNDGTFAVPGMAKPERDERRRAVAYFATAGLALFTALIAYNGAEEVVRALAVAGPALPGVALLHLVPLVANAAGWRCLLPRTQSVGIGPIVRARWISESVNGLLPAMQIGGNVVRARLLVRRGVPLAIAGASVVVDVTLNLLAQLAFTLVGLAVLGLYLGAGELALVLSAGFVIMGSLVAVFYVSQQRGLFSRSVSLMGRLARDLQRGALAMRAQDLDVAVRRIYGDRRALVLATTWHFASWVAGAGEVWLGLYILGHPLGLFSVLLIESVIQAMRTVAFSIPAALGVQEGAYLLLGTAFGVSPETALALALVKRFRELTLGLPGLLAWWLDEAAPAPVRGGAEVTRRPPGATPMGPRSDDATRFSRRPRPRPRSAAQELVTRGMWVGIRLVDGHARPFVSLDRENLLASAQRRAGVPGFEDLAFLDGLDCLLHSLEVEARLNLLGRIVSRNQIIRLLTNRLAMERDRRRSPEIAAQEIRRPIFIAGLPRSGSTLLHGLLAQDPANRVPLAWELLEPSPPPERATYESDPRIASAERLMRWFHVLAPEFRKIHAVGARRPEECVMILAHSFCGSEFCSMFGVPSYQKWLEGQDLVPAYLLHRRFLQHLQSHHAGERWVLKAPTHLSNLRALLDVYPDAAVIMTHRDPLEVLGSEASLQTTLRRVFGAAAEPVAIGREVTESLAGAIRKGLAARDDGFDPPQRCFDLRYSDLLADPMAEARRIYQHFDLPLTAVAEGRMRDFLAAVPKDMYGVHEYSLGEFGLDTAAERERYRGYRERFAV